MTGGWARAWLESLARTETGPPPGPPELFAGQDDAAARAWLDQKAIDAGEIWAASRPGGAK